MCGGILDRGDGVADAGLADVLDLGGDEADFAGAKLRQLLDLGPHTAYAVDQMFGPTDHELDVLALLDDAVHDADQNDDAQIGVIPTVDQHRLQRRIPVALGRGDFGDDGFQYVVDADARFGRRQHRLRCVETDHLLNFRAHLFGLGGGQVDLVEDGHDLMVMLDGLIDIGQRLRLNPLRRVDDQQRAFACGKAARHFIGEVDMARRVHQVQFVQLTVARGVIEAHGLRLDGDAAFLFDVHIVEHLRRHFPVGQAPGALDQAVGQG